MVSGDMVVEALDALGLLKAKVDALHQMLDAVLIRPRLEVLRNQGDVPTFEVDAEDPSTIQITRRSKDLSAGITHPHPHPTLLQHL